MAIIDIRRIEDRDEEKKIQDIPKIQDEPKTPKPSYLIPEIMHISLEIFREASQSFNDLYIKKSVPILFDRVLMAIVLDGVAGYFNRDKLPRAVEDCKRYCKSAIIGEEVNFSALFDRRMGDPMRRYDMESNSKPTDDQKVEAFYREYGDSFISPLMRMIGDCLDQKFPNGLEIDCKLLRPDLYVTYDKSFPSKVAFTSMDDTLIEGKEDKDKQIFLFLKALKSLAREIVRNVGVLDEIKGASNAFHKAMEIALGIRPSDSEWSIWKSYFSGDMARGLYFCENKSLEGIINNLIHLPKDEVRKAVEVYKSQVPNSGICMRESLLLQEEYAINTAPDSGREISIQEFRPVIEEQSKGYVDAMHELLCKLFFEGEERYAIEATDSLGSSKRIKDLIGEYYHTRTTFKLTSCTSSYDSPRKYSFRVEVSFCVAECI